jgi:hypothetical protein
MFQRLNARAVLPAMTLLMTAPGCVDTVPVPAPAEADEIEAAVNRADENALSARSGAQEPPERTEHREQ